MIGRGSDGDKRDPPDRRLFTLLWHRGLLFRRKGETYRERYRRSRPRDADRDRLRHAICTTGRVFSGGGGGLQTGPRNSGSLRKIYWRVLSVSGRALGCADRRSVLGLRRARLSVAGARQGTHASGVLDS